MYVRVCIPLLSIPFSPLPVELGFSDCCFCLLSFVLNSRPFKLFLFMLLYLGALVFRARLCEFLFV